MTVPAVASAVDRALDAMSGTRLDDLGAASLLNRVDTKYIVPVALVPALVAGCATTYRALEVSGRRTFRYHTRYFDTPQHSLFRAHVTGHLPRRKVRIRTYADDGLHVLEVKHKTNRGRTEKVRLPVPSNAPASLDALRDARFGATPPTGESLQAALDVEYTRLTLVHLDGSERVTIDLDLTYHGRGTTEAFPRVAIVEVKQRRRQRSPMTELLRQARLRPIRLSKYCVGIAALAGGAPTPTYRRLLSHLHAPGRAVSPAP